MNKNDLKLIIVVVLIASTFLAFFKLFESGKSKKAIVYFENKVVLTIDLEDKRKREYEVEGYNGKVTIESFNGKVKVNEEKSPLHLCSKQGYISSSYETIVCLPNKITIKIETNDDLDTVIK